MALMRLNRVEVTNHSRIADLSVEVRGHAVIVGANDVGKTSLLRMLHLLLGCTTTQLYQQTTVADLGDSAGGGIPFLGYINGPRQRGTSSP
jgi:putative ATP-dependent endonuclease of the OLD family